MSFAQVMLIPMLNEMTAHLNKLVQLIDLENQILSVAGFGNKEQINNDAKEALKLIDTMKKDCSKVGCPIEFTVKDKVYSWHFVEA